MAARGAIAKEQIIEKLLQFFPGSFKNDKEIRIPVEENGEEIQIKVTLTAAKVNVPNPNEESVAFESTSSDIDVTSSKADVAEVAELTEEEKKEVEDLMKTLNL